MESCSHCVMQNFWWGRRGVPEARRVLSHYCSPTTCFDGTFFWNMFCLSQLLGSSATIVLLISPRESRARPPLTRWLVRLLLIPAWPYPWRWRRSLVGCRLMVWRVGWKIPARQSNETLAATAPACLSNAQWLAVRKIYATVAPQR